MTIGKVKTMTTEEWESGLLQLEAELEQAQTCGVGGKMAMIRRLRHLQHNPHVVDDKKDAAPTEEKQETLDESEQTKWDAYNTLLRTNEESAAITLRRAEFEHQQAKESLIQHAKCNPADFKSGEKRKACAYHHPTDREISIVRKLHVWGASDEYGNNASSSNPV